MSREARGNGYRIKGVESMRQLNVVSHADLDLDITGEAGKT